MTYIAYTSGSYKLRIGHVSKSEMTSAYEWTQRAKTTNQKWSKWMKPVGNSHYDKWQETPVSLSGDARGQGQGSGSWLLAGLEASMWDYIENDAAMFNGQASQDFTIETWNPGRWETVWIKAYLRKPSEAGERSYRKGYKNYRMDFLVLQEAPDGPDLTVAITYTPPVTVSVNEAFTVTVTNPGDADTFDDVVVTIPIASGFTHVTWTGTGWTREYREGGVWVSSPSVPANVTDIRATYDSALLAGATATALTLTLVPTSSGSKTLIATVATTGDTNAANDSDSEIITVVP